MDIGLRAILSGFEEAKRHFQDLSKEIDKTADATDKLGKSSKSASEGVKGLGDNIPPVDDKVDKLGTSALVAAGIIGTVFVAALKYGAEHLAEGISRVREYGEELHQLSQRTGLSVESLGSFRLAAETNNMSLSGFAQGVQQFNRHISDATKETGASAEAFGRLDISVKDSTGRLKSNEVLLGEVADKFAAMNDGVGKTTLAVELFGRSGANMIPILNAGSLGLASIAEEAKKAGIVMDQETAEAASKLNANMTVLKAYGEGFWISVASPIVEGLAKITTHLREARLEGEGFLGTLQKLAQYAFGVGNLQQEFEGVNSRRALLLSERNAINERVRAGDRGAAAMLPNVEAQLAALEPDWKRLFTNLNIKDAPGFVGDLPVNDKFDAPERDLSGQTAKQADSTLMGAAGYYGQLHGVGKLSDETYLQSLQALRGGFGGDQLLPLEMLIRKEQERQAQIKAAGLLAGAQGAAFSFTGQSLIDDTYSPEEMARYKAEADYRARMKKAGEKDTENQLLAREKQLQDMVSVPTKDGPIFITKAEWEAGKRNPVTFQEGLDAGVKSYFSSISSAANAASFSGGLLKAVETSFTAAFRTGHLSFDSLAGAIKDQLASFAGKETMRALQGVFSPLMDMLLKPLSMVADFAGNLIKGFIADFLGTTFTTAATQETAATALTASAVALDGAAAALSAAAGVEGVAGAGVGAGAVAGGATAGGLAGLGWATMAGMFAGIAYGAYNIFKNGLLNPLAAFFGGTMFASFPQKIFEPFANAFSRVVDFAVDGIGSILNAFVDLIDGVFEFFGDGFEQLMDTLGGFFDMISDFLSTIGDFVSSISDLGGGLFGGDGGLLGGLFGSDDGGGLLGGITDSIFPGLGDVFGGIGDVFGFATGTDMIVSQPTTFTAGEAGAERVTVSPLSGAARTALGGSGTSYNFYGPVMLDEYTMRRFKQMLAK